MIGMTVTPRLIAMRALDRAREAWKEADLNPNEETVRVAMQACLVAAHTLRKISADKKAERLEFEAATLEAKLEVLSGN